MPYHPTEDVRTGVETTLASGLNELGAYYNENHLRPNPAKTQLTAFQLNNHQADRKLNVTWNGTKLDHTHSPVYLGITLDRSLAYRNHCLKTLAKLSSRNNLLRKLHGTNWGACPHTMMTTAIALCLSVAEYCCPVCSPVHLFQNTLRPKKNCNRIVLNGFVFSNYLKTTYTKSTKIESAIAA